MRWYPYDTITCSNIESFLSLKTHTPFAQNLLVGIVYENEKVRRSSRLLETLLSNPLSEGSESWYARVRDRSPTDNNLILDQKSRSNSIPEALLRTVRVYEVPSPVLDGESRQAFRDVLPPLDSTPNNLQLLEINHMPDIAKLVGVCLFYIYVTCDVSSLLDALPKAVQKKILLTVVDNPEFTPRSTEASRVSFLSSTETSRHVIKVDSLALSQGIADFYKNGAQAGAKYFEAYQASNIIEVLKFMQWSLRTENLRKWLLNLVKSEIAATGPSGSQVRAVYEDLKLKTLAEGANNMHKELQHDFFPRTQAFFKEKLPWWQLYMKNDNVEYILKDYFGTHFMPKSIDGYSYLKGQLVARLQELKFADYAEKDRTHITNPLQSFKTDLVEVRIPAEVQPVVYGCLVSAFFYYQLPLALVSVCGHLWLGLQAQNALGIAALGMVLGFNHVSREWHKFTEKWLAELFDQIRLVISRECVEEGLLKELNARFKEAKALERIKQQVSQVLEKTGSDKNI